MTERQLTALLIVLPQAQRKEAGRRVMEADKLGWHGFGFFGDDMGRADLMDLCGVDPKGTLHFLADKFDGRPIK